METKMKNVSELKKLVLTQEDQDQFIKDKEAWLRSKFKEEDSVGGACIYWADENEEKFVLIITYGESLLTLDHITSISDFSNGYCEVVTENNEHKIFAGMSHPLPLDLKGDFDRVYKDPLAIEYISEEKLSKYWPAFAFVGTMSLNNTFNEIKDGNSSFGLIRGITLTSDNQKFKRLVLSFENKYGTMEELNNQLANQYEEDEEEYENKVDEDIPAPEQVANENPILNSKATVEQLKSTLQKFMEAPTANAQSLNSALIEELEESAKTLDELILVKKTINSYNNHFPAKNTKTLGISDFEISAYLKRANELNEDFSIFCAVNSQEETPENFEQFLQILHSINKTKSKELTEERKAKIVEIATETKQNIIENLNTKQ